MTSLPTRPAKRQSQASIATPYLWIDGVIAQQNIERLASYAKQHGLSIRPHTKTHKSLHLAKMQLAAGAGGLTVAKVGEAEVMAAVCDDLLIAYPAVDPSRCERIAALALRVDVKVAVDSVAAADAIAGAARHVGATVGLLVDLDVGMGRTGVQSPADAEQLAIHVDRTTGVDLRGLFCYPGHIWDPADAQGASLAKTANWLQATLEAWRTRGLNSEIVSGGSTPTAYQSHLIPQLTEIRPGTYVFNDLSQALGGYCEMTDVAAYIEATVVSDAVPGQVVIDAGTKTLTSDRCHPRPDGGHGRILQYPLARLTKLTEEHGQVDVSRCGRPPRIGERVTIVPNHICPCVNLQDSIWRRDDPQHDAFEAFVVDARGKLS